MNLFFDEESQKILVAAKKEMYELKHPYVGSEHLLLAILKNTDLDITKSLKEYGITYERFKKELISVIGVGSKCNNWFLFTPLLKRILNNATYCSKDENKNVSPYSLFISILQEGDGVANRILLGMNVDLELLYDKFISTSFVNKNVNKKLMISDFAINMNEESLNNKYDPVVGREEQINQLIQILLRKNKNNPILIGEAGVGKTAIVEEVARKISHGDVPLKLKDKIIYNVSMSCLISGTKYRGEFEERFNKIISELKDNPNIILFIDEIHTLVGAGGAEGAIDASNILKPYLARGDIKVIGATTLSEYSKYIEKDKALERRFQKIYVEEATKEEVKNIIAKLCPVYERFHNVSISNNLVELLINLADKYISKGKQPDKTIDFLDEVCCYAAINNKNELVINDYASKISSIEEQKKIEILNHNFKEALKLRKEEGDLKSEYNNILVNFDSSLDKTVVREDDLYNVLYNKSGVLVGSILKKKTKNLVNKLKKCVYGQDEAIDLVISSLENTNYVSKSVCNSILLVGKKGCGKTFLVEKIIDNLFKKDNLIKLNMGEYGQDYEFSKIIGATPGYVGYNDRGSFLDKLQEKNFAVVLLEDIDKCNKRVLDFFSKAFENKYFVNSRGEKIDISNVIFFMTQESNFNSLGFVEAKLGNSIDEVLLKNASTVVKFNDIKEKSIRKYIMKKLNDLNIKIENNEVVNNIVKESNYSEYGFEKVDNLFDKYFLMTNVKS